MCFAVRRRLRTGDLSGWKVVVVVVEKPRISLAWEDGKLMLRPGGM